MKGEINVVAMSVDRRCDWQIVCLHSVTKSLVFGQVLHAAPQALAVKGIGNTDLSK